MRLLAGSAAVLVLVFATACGGGSTPTEGTGNNPSSSSTAAGPAASATPKPEGPAADCAQEAAASGPVISMQGTHSLDPSDETIAAGESVTFTNNSTTNHQISFDGGPNCGYTLIGKSVSIQFDRPGTYTYVCAIHPTFMKGTITVQ